MNKKLLTIAALAATAGTAHAQSSVTLYGVIDAGISYVNHSKTANGGTGKLFKYDDGVAQGSRWGLRGTEDLGGGLKAIFVLENGFNSGNGTIGQGGAIFGRQAYVGLSQSQYGTVTFGRQYSFSTDILGSNYSTGGNTVAGNYAYHVNDLDQLTSSRINNAVKFQSANYSGFTFGALYGFSNSTDFAGAPATTTGTTTTAGSSRAYSFGLNYANGPFSLGAAYTDIRFPSQSTPAFSTTIANIATGNVRDLRTYGVGGRYVWARQRHGCCGRVRSSRPCRARAARSTTRMKQARSTPSRRLCRAASATRTRTPRRAATRGTGTSQRYRRLRTQQAYGRVRPGRVPASVGQGRASADRLEHELLQYVGHGFEEPDRRTYRYPSQVLKHPLNTRITTASAPLRALLWALSFA